MFDMVLTTQWALWVGLLAGAYLLIRGIVLIVIGRTIWGIFQIAGTIIFFGALAIWMIYQVQWAQYGVFAAILLLLVPLFLYPRMTLRHDSKPPSPPESGK